MNQLNVEKNMVIQEILLMTREGSSLIKLLLPIFIELRTNSHIQIDN